MFEEQWETTVTGLEWTKTQHVEDIAGEQQEVQTRSEIKKVLSRPVTV
jgi:hypothetical protein